MYRKTGEQSIGAGVYHSECRCRTEIAMRKGETFPDCPRCKAAVGWLFTRSVHHAAPPPASKQPEPPRQA